MTQRSHDTNEGMAASLRSSRMGERRPRRAPKLLASLLAVDVLVLAWVLHPDHDEPRFATVGELADSECHSLTDRLIHVQGALVPKSLVAYTNPGECRFKITSSNDEPGKPSELEVISEPCNAPDFLRDVDGRQTRVTVVGTLQRPTVADDSTLGRLRNAFGLQPETHDHPTPAVSARHLDANQIYVDVHGAFEMGNTAVHPTVRPVPTIER